MLAISGYQIFETIQDGINKIIYRGIREADQQPVILKVLQAENPTIEQISRLKHEYKIIANLDLEGIVKVYSFESSENYTALILEDFGGESLKKLLNRQKLNLTTFLSIGIQLAQALAGLHQNQIVHKDIKPANIIINPETGQIKITDFSIASQLNKENAQINNPNQIEGTLAYMSPEQTGRMNRAIDYHTDFYSLGVTFYEMLTGEIPYKSNDLLELVHCHIARQPIPLQELNPVIPDAIAAIVMKLLAKNAEDRYHSGLGLKADLETCLTQWQNQGAIPHFIPGQLDRSGQLLIPQKLYGRETEIQQLMAAFDRISQGKSEIVLVSGFSGIGKSSLVNEVHKPIVRQRGYFISGKFDQFKRNIPYSALAQAFSELIRQLLTESQAKIASWKEQILQAVGNNGQIIIDIIPEVELIIGTQPAVPKLGTTESQNRFNQVFQEFVRTFTKASHPLVLFVDDLQWSDPASLQLIKLLITDSDSYYLLFLGAYRDNEVNDAHPLIQALEAVTQAGVVINNIVLPPFQLSHVQELIGDTLNEAENYQDLAALLFQHTQGNAFFLTQLLKTLHQEQFLKYNFEKNQWQWEIDQIESVGIADINVVELVAGNIQKLPLATQKVLKLAACIGDRFNLEVLAIVNETSLSETSEALWTALQVGLILPLSNEYKIPLSFTQQEMDFFKIDRSRIIYKFLHDRVQQAAYSLIPEEQKKVTHLKIGQLLLEKITEDDLAENIFDVVNQLNIGANLIIYKSEKERLAKLNLMAGRKAKLATAYEAAAKYLNAALAVLPEASWQSQYELTRDIYLEALEVEYINANFERSQQLSEIFLKNTKTLLEKIKVYEQQILFYFAQNQIQKSLDTALAVLKLLGISLPKNPSKFHIIAGLIRAKLALGTKQIEDLARLPKMTAPDKLAAIKILLTVVPTVTNLKPALFPIIVFKMIELCLKYGNSPLSPHIYGSYGMLLCGGLDDIDSGYQFGQLSLKLLEELNAKDLKAKIYFFFNNFIKHWKRHLQETKEYFLEGLQSAIENGDIEYIGYNALIYCIVLFWNGENLEYVAQQNNKYLEIILKYKQEVSADFLRIQSQFVLNLMGDSEEKYNLIGEKFNEIEKLNFLEKAKNNTVLACIYIVKAILAYIFKNYSSAVDNFKLCTQYKDGLAGTIFIPNYNFYYSLSLLADYSTNSANQQQEYLKQVAINQKQMKTWANHAPCNFQHKYELVAAEKARVLQEDIKAMSLYNSAIRGAKEFGYTHEEALANERAAEFYLHLGNQQVAKTYMREAYYGYVKWGAKAKIKDLEERYPELVPQTNKTKIDPEPSNFEIESITQSTTKGNLDALDLSAIVRASQAISGEIVLEQLLKKLMQILMKNAGAQKILLFLIEAERLVLASTADIEAPEEIILPFVPMTEGDNLPVSLINYVQRTQEILLLNNALVEGRFTNEPYTINFQPKSVLGLPIIYQSKFIGILYLENRLTQGVFTQERLGILQALVAQISISIENARVYEMLEQKVEERTQELQQKNQQLSETLSVLQQTQSQLIQSEKMSSLGQLVGGVAHEINNPVTFIAGNLDYTNESIQKILHLIEQYNYYYPNPVPEIAEEIQEIELENLIEDLPNSFNSMKKGAERIKSIVLSLRDFSQKDKAEINLVNIHTGIESTLLILQYELSAKPDLPEIAVIKNYGDLPRVECYVAKLNQVMINLLNNAIYAVRKRKLQEIGNENYRPTIWIATELIDSHRITIRITDNGIGIPESDLPRIFDPFFTTKPVGSGTGLGLSISYQIIVETHGGELKCSSELGKGTEMAIAIPIQQSS